MLKSLLPIALLCICMDIAFAQSGSLDSTFSEDGLVIRNLGSNTFDLPYGAALQKDGKILIVGISSGNFVVLRYLPDGSTDADFNFNGLISADYNGFDDRAHAVTVQPDGKIVVAGETQVNGQPDFAILRLHPDGTPDSTFGTNGWAVTDLGTDFEFPNCVALQPDGKILAAGRRADGFVSDFAMVRYHPDGQLDTLFGDHGIVATSLRDEDEAFAIAIEPDDQIILAGFASVSALGDFALARYNPDGSLDKFFGSGGKVLTDMEGFNRSDFIKGMVLQPDGKILVAGNANNDNIGQTSDAGMARYEANGDLDTTFGTSGKYIIPLGSKTDINSIALQPDGKILLGGNSDVAEFENRWLLARFHPDGTLDATFGSFGITTTDMPGTREYVNKIFVQPDSRVILTGGVGNLPGLDFAAARYIADFTLSVSVEEITCYGASEGSIIVDAAGGVPPYGYSIDGGATYQSENIFTGLPAGIYTVIIRDSNGPGVTGTIGPIEIIEAPEPPTVFVDAGADSDMIFIYVYGNADGFRYSIDGGITFQTDSVFSGLADGDYDVVVIDQHGCVIHTEQVHISTLGIASLYTLPFEIAPNPGDGLITVTWIAGGTGMTVHVTDMTGRIVYTGSIDDTADGHQQLDLRHLSEGFYLVTLTDKYYRGSEILMISRQ